MVALQTLENIPTENLLQVFNLSFSDYVVPFSLTKAQLEAKIKSDSIRLEYSVGAFEDNQLIAFLLHGYDFVDNLKVVYNAGTGVIPAKRGNRLTTQLYEYVLPILHQNNIDKVLLEVITTNESAIKTYQNIGFKTTRQLNCFKGSIDATNTTHFEVRELAVYDWSKLQSFWDFKPSWQNSVTAVEKLKQSNISIGLYENGQLAGYVIYNPVLNRIQQLAVDKNQRRKGIGRQLVEYISTNYGKNISMINVDHVSKETFEFLTATGMEMYIKQHEMEFDLK